ncbi:hypothetical protein ACFWV1_25840 [Streptomyces sp. NPDC058700]|uniref:hypothetical protein n=1 Tax=Streptomyces sp. NPDC058700 TaxID=3346607 RepID=UPI00364B3609
MDASNSTPGPGNLILLTDGQLPGAVIDPTASDIHTLVIHGPGERPLVTLNTETGEIKFGPDYDPDEAAAAFWAAVRRMGTAPALVAQQDGTQVQPEATRYDCPLCDWYTNPTEGGSRHSAVQQIGGHILGTHGLDIPTLVHRLVKLLPNNANNPTPPPNRMTERLADELCRTYDFLPLSELEADDTDRAQEHWAAAHDLRGWMKRLPTEDEEAAFKRGFDRAMSRVKRHIADLEAALAGQQEVAQAPAPATAVAWSAARKDPRYPTIRRVILGLETVDGQTALSQPLQELLTLRVLSALHAGETEAAKHETGRITDFNPSARSDARKDVRYAAVVEQVRKMAWPAGQPMVPGGWADTLATDVMAAVRKEEGQHRLITHHAYAGPGPCTARYLGAEPCGYPAGEHDPSTVTVGNT